MGNKRRPINHSDWNQAHEFLLNKSKTLPLLHKVLKSNGSLEIGKPREPDLFKFMCRTLTGQQLSTHAARSLWNKVTELCEREQKDLFSICDGSKTDSLRGCGLSGNKVMAMERLRKVFLEKVINKEILHDLEDEEVKEKIGEIWGFGPWSAEMILIGYLGRQDVWSVNDSSLQRGIKLAVKSTEDTEKIVRRFKPYRTLLARHIWKGLDEGRLT